MTTQRGKFIQTFFVAAIAALCLPVIAAAQGNYDPYRNGRDERRNNNYDQRALRESVQRVKNRSDDFRKHLDSALDHSRYDGKRREDRINDTAKDFQSAANRLKDRYDDGRNLNRSADEARRLLQLGAQIDRFIERSRLDERAMADWSDIRQNLRVIANAYGFRISDFGNGYNRRDNADYRRF